MSAISEPHADRVRQSGTFDLPIPVKDAFPLFTIEGERDWVPGWEPIILGQTPQAAGLVCLTGSGDEYTIWTVLKSDPEEGVVQYSRVTPASRAGTVQVSLLPITEGARVTVSYDLTALSERGQRDLDAYRHDKFAEMMAGWKELVHAYLDR